jgi:hypothetical protein
LKTLPGPMSTVNPFAFPDKNDDDDTLVFYKYCAMCGLKFPNDAMEIKVIALKLEYVYVYIIFI